MKNIKYISYALLGGILAFGACKKPLDLTPPSSLTPEQVGPEDAPKLLSGIYDALQQGNQGSAYYYLSYVTEDLSADNLRYRATFFQHGEIDNNAILENNVLVSRYFNAPYVVIQRANDLLEILNSNPDISEDISRPLYSQAYFLRAYAYYKLVSTFGPVPIVFNRDIIEVPRNSEDEVYKQIVTDLQASIGYNDTFTSAYFASAEASKALLARVYLIQNNLPLAKQMADEVINSGKFSLSSNYASMFTSPYESTEHIFKLNFTVTEGENSLDFFLQHPSMPGGGRAELPVDQSLVDAYEAGDSRKAASIQEISAPLANPGWYCKKYQDPSGNGAVPMYILRLSEMYLISAEASYRMSNNSSDSEALAKLNDVRTKRGLSTKNSLTLVDIIHERRVELAFEGTRWADLKRTPSPSNPSKSMATVYLEAKGRSATDQLYPIPQSAIDRNPMLLPQNPGY